MGFGNLNPCGAVLQLRVWINAPRYSEEVHASEHFLFLRCGGGGYVGADVTRCHSVHEQRAGRGRNFLERQVEFPQH